VAARGALRKPFTQSDCAALNYIPATEKIYISWVANLILYNTISLVVEDLLEFKNISDKCRTVHNTLEKQKWTNHFMTNLIYMYQVTTMYNSGNTTVHRALYENSVNSVIVGWKYTIQVFTTFRIV
jgi:hypothetical protein